MTITVYGILGVYLAGVLLVLILWKTGILQVRTQMVWILLLIPIAGTVIFLIEAKKEKQHREPIELPLKRMNPEEAIPESLRMPDTEDNSETVPLDEAIVMNDQKLGRQLMLDLLHLDPQKSIDALESASLSSDTELSHYATTAMASIQSGFEKDIEKAEKSLKETPEDPYLLKHLHDVLKEYLDSGMIDGAVSLIYRQKLDDCLKKLMEREPENMNYRVEHVENRIAFRTENGKDSEDVSWSGIKEETEHLMEADPMNARVYKTAMLYAMRTHDQAMSARVLESVRSRHVYLNKEDREWFDFWSGKEESDVQG